MIVINIFVIILISVIFQEKRVLLAKEGEHGNVIYIVPPICITEEDVTEVIIIINHHHPCYRRIITTSITRNPTLKVARCLDEALAEAEMIGLEKIRWELALFPLYIVIIIILSS